ncbi:hypothetical protein [Actinacidiphila glaucinigra]|uniref:hypothetical protein n=1 Tax=Actinacidiphila glaucinigra TaxID=235986 RepID=UPI0035D73442
MTASPFDMSDVNRLERHLTRGIPQARRDARAVTRRGAMNIKRDWAQNARASAPRHAPAYPRSISYDVYPYTPDMTIAEIGPDKGRTQGALGNLLEYGSVHNPPHNDGGRALAVELPRFEAQIAAIVARGMAWGV